MVSRSNLSGRPGMGGVLGKVFKPPTQRVAKRAVPQNAPGIAGLVDQGGGGGFFSKLRSAVEAKQATQMPARGTLTRAEAQGRKKPSAMQAPVAGQKRGPRRQPTAREQAKNTREVITGMRGQAQQQRAGLENMGATQEEVATSPRGVIERAAAGAGRRRFPPRQLAAQEQAEEARGALEATGEAGGTVTEAPVTEPSLNQARRSRSRSGRMYRR